MYIACTTADGQLFGISSFSTNWGFLSLAPGIFGNAFNLLFGRIYDWHSDPLSHECRSGSACYQVAFLVSGIAASLAFLLATFLFFRNQKTSNRRRKLAIT